MIKDANILLSLVNTYLRNNGGTIKDFAFENDVEQSELEATLNKIGYYYDEKQNKFISK